MHLIWTVDSLEPLQLRAGHGQTRLRRIELAPRPRASHSASQTHHAPAAATCPAPSPQERKQLKEQGYAKATVQGVLGKASEGKGTWMVLRRPGAKRALEDGGQDDDMQVWVGGCVGGGGWGGHGVHVWNLT